MTRTSCILLAAILGSLPACKKTDSTSGAASASASASAAPVLKPGVDAALLGEIKTLVKTCKVDDKNASVNCPEGEQRKLIGEFVTNKRPREKALATFAAALSDPDPQMRTMAAHVLNSAFRSSWGPEAKPGSVDAAAAQELLTAAMGLTKAQTRQALPAAVHASVLAGNSASLFAALDKAAQSTEPDLATTGYRYVMTYGRLEAFPKVQQLAKSTNIGLVISALDSPRNMHDWTAAEQAAICPWAMEFLDDKRPAVGSRAAMLLASCSGEYIDKLLSHGEAAFKNKSFSTTHVSAYRDLCAPHQVKQESGPSEAQCKRARKLLETVIESKALNEQARITALTSLAYQWPDEDSLKLAKKMTKAPEKNLAEQATRTAERLEQRGGGAKKDAGKPPKPGAGTKPASPARAPAAADE